MIEKKAEEKKAVKKKAVKKKVTKKIVRPEFLDSVDLFNLLEASRRLENLEQNVQLVTQKRINAEMHLQLTRIDLEKAGVEFRNAANGHQALINEITTGILKLPKGTRWGYNPTTGEISYN